MSTRWCFNMRQRGCERGEVASDEPSCHRWNETRMRRCGRGIRKCMNTKKRRRTRWHATGRERSDRTESAERAESHKSPEKQERLDQSDARIQSWRWSPCSLRVFYPRGLLPPAPTSSLLLDNQSQDPITLSPPHTLLPNTPIGTRANMHACTI